MTQVFTNGVFQSGYEKGLTLRQYKVGHNLECYYKKAISNIYKRGVVVIIAGNGNKRLEREIETRELAMLLKQAWDQGGECRKSTGTTLKFIASFRGTDFVTQAPRKVAISWMAMRRLRAAARGEIIDPRPK